MNRYLRIDFDLPQDVKIWEISNGVQLSELPKSKLDLEEHLETWLEKDISVISDNLLVIGRQVATDFGGFIDLMCIDRNGDLVIIELKKDKTPREIIAQVLDYAASVKDLSHERIVEIARKYFDANGSLDEAFERKFGDTLPEVLNENHKMLIVASDLDSSTERVLNYLSETYGVGINAVNFQHYKKDNREYLARVFLIEPEIANRANPGSKRRPPLTEQELEEIAENNGVKDLYSGIIEGLIPIFDGKVTTRSSIAFVGRQNEKRNVIFSLIPDESNASRGLKFQVYMKRFCEFLKISMEKADSLLPKDKAEWKYYGSASPEYSGYQGFFKDAQEIREFLTGITERRQTRT